MYMTRSAFEEQLGRRPLNLVNNHEANIWHFYKSKIIRKFQLLPLSISQTRLKTCQDKALSTFMKFHGHKIPIIPKGDLASMIRNLETQFSALTCASGPVKYANYPIGIHMAKSDGHYTDTISKLAEHNSKILPYILGHGDYYSALRLVRLRTDTSCLSIVASRKIFQGTVILEYGGCVLSGEHVPEDVIGTASSSFTWTALEHPDGNRDILLHPAAYSNLGRFINGVRADEQHLVNVVVMKVQDKDLQVRTLLVAFSDIEVNEHLFYFYGDFYPTEWTEHGTNKEFIRMAEFVAQDWEDVIYSNAT